VPAFFWVFAVRSGSGVAVLVIGTFMLAGQWLPELSVCKDRHIGGYE
jgi:hypothetical protein